MAFGTFRAKAVYGIARIMSPQDGIAFVQSLADDVQNRLYWRTAIVALEHAEKERHPRRSCSTIARLANALQTDRLLIGWTE
jgi:hypothetical protein